MKKYKLSALLLIGILVSGSFVGCSIPNLLAATPINSERKLSTLTNENATLADQLDDTYVKGLNQFAYQIFSKLTGVDNILISPYSISLALSMLYNGADGDTRTEMAELFGYQNLTGYTDTYHKESNQFMNSNTKYLMDTLQESDPDTEIDIANSIWLTEDAQFKDTIDGALLEPVREYFNGDIFQTDFTENKNLNQMNQWVSDKTKGIIDPFFEEFPDKEAMRLLLVNAIYFNGKWSNPFSPDDTRQEVFNGMNQIETVDMMYMHREEYRYYSADGMRGIEIPYGNGNLVMNVLIPEDVENNYISNLYQELTTEEVEQFLKKIDSADKVELETLALPKFEMEYGVVSLNDALSELGMKQAFESGKADFSLISDDLYVGQVAHKAKIQVEEWGTKAAAATGVTLETTAIEVDPLQFIANVPFIFLIRDKQTDTILFMGEMNNM